MKNTKAQTPSYHTPIFFSYHPLHYYHIRNSKNKLLLFLLALPEIITIILHRFSSTSSSFLLSIMERGLSPSLSPSFSYLEK
ncbi:hypothetical protein PIB30_037265, partial [Stylosanthes scabra]|nr:hypothetical protein [Stylosanthes scabra]